MKSGLILTLTILIFGCTPNKPTESSGNLENVDSLTSSDNRQKLDFAYQESERNGITCYIFHESKKPILKLTGHDISDVNEVLAYLNLPEVDDIVREQEMITGSRTGRGKYLWNSYS